VLWKDYPGQRECDIKNICNQSAEKETVRKAKQSSEHLY
jgi:hypothetical protein